ncbi:hypothetical protein FQN60_003407, partial [Etheostoma spectabile]
PVRGQLLLRHPRPRVRQEPGQHALLQGGPGQAPRGPGGGQGLRHPGPVAAADQLQAGAGGAEDPPALVPELPAVPEGLADGEGGHPVPPVRPRQPVRPHQHAALPQQRGEALAGLPGPQRRGPGAPGRRAPRRHQDGERDGDQLELGAAHRLRQLQAHVPAGGQPRRLQLLLRHVAAADVLHRAGEVRGRQHVHHGERPEHAAGGPEQQQPAGPGGAQTGHGHLLRRLCDRRALHRGRPPLRPVPAAGVSEGHVQTEHVLLKIEDRSVRELVAQMVQREPERRLTAEEYLKQQRGKAFPDIFYTFLQPYMAQFAKETFQSADERVLVIRKDLDNILHNLRGGEWGPQV